MAAHEGKDPEEVLTEAVQRYLADYREKRILTESQIWYQLSAEIRNRYWGKFVAVYNGEIVDNDPDRMKLYQRMREKYGRQPVLLVEGGDQPMPEYSVCSTN